MSLSLYQLSYGPSKGKEFFRIYCLLNPAVAFQKKSLPWRSYSPVVSECFFYPGIVKNFYKA